MTTEAPSPTVSTAALLAQHRAMREAIAGLSREAARVPPPEWADWCEAVSLRIRILRAQLKRHFAQEEAAGLVQQIEAKAPEHSEACQRLLGEHAVLLARLDALAMDVLLRVDPTLWAGTLREMLSDLVRHEEREDELLLKALDQAPGAPD